MTVSKHRSFAGRATRRSASTASARTGHALYSGLVAVVGLVATLGAGLAIAQTSPKTDDEKAFYTIGSGMAEQFKALQPISEREVDVLVQGIRDALSGKALAVEQQQGGQLVRDMVQERRQRAIGVEKAAAAAYIADQASKKGARTTDSGLVYTELEAGSGASPAATDTVSVHYHGTLRDGTVFDSSVDRGQPAEFPLNRVIPCWTEGVAMMKVGGKSKLVCPAEIAYGDRSQGRIPGGAALTFEVELLDIVDKK